MWLEANNILPTIRGANYAAENGDMDMLLWLETKKIYPNKCGYDGAAFNGHLNVMKWMASKKTRGLLQRGINKYISNKIFEVDAIDIIAERNAANNAARNGHIDILDWLESRGALPDNQYESFGAGNIDTLLWLQDRGINLNYYIANNAAMDGNIDVLFWLEDRNILPDHIGANYAVHSGYPNIILWLAYKGIFPDNGILPAKGVFLINPDFDPSPLIFTRPLGAAELLLWSRKIQPAEYYNSIY